MRKLLFQSDDYGLTDSVADGILKGIDQGIIRNTGLFVNMPSSARAAAKIRDRQGVCVGIDINLVAGRPVSDPAEVPSLVNPDGHFVPSVQRMREGKITGRQGMCLCFEEDPYDYEQTLLETENQVKRFIELMGRKQEFLKSLEASLSHEIGYFICHCGFVEEDLMKETTYTMIRMKDLAMATSPRVRAFLQEHQIELITYRDLKEGR